MSVVSRLLGIIGNLCTRLVMPSFVHYGKNSTHSFCDGHSVRGKNNIIEFGDHCQLYRCRFIIKGDNNKIIIGDRCRLSYVTFWITGDNSTIKLDDGTTVSKGTQFASMEGTRIEVGKDCMFSHDILVRTSDSHSIVNSSGERINQAKDIVIGNHCWVGLQSLILKGSRIGDNCVLAARSTLNKCFPESGCLLGGAPAKVLKTEINWDRDRL